LSFNNKTKEVSGFITKDDAADFMDLWRSIAHGEFANNGKTGSHYLNLVAH